MYESRDLVQSIVDKMSERRNAIALLNATQPGKDWEALIPHTTDEEILWDIFANEVKSIISKAKEELTDIPEQLVQTIEYWKEWLNKVDAHTALDAVKNFYNKNNEKEVTE